MNRIQMAANIQHLRKHGSNHSPEIQYSSPVDILGADHLTVQLPAKLLPNDQTFKENEIQGKLPSVET